jgi:hypothetical protein
MQYIKDGGTLPVPFNTIPTPKSFYYLCKKLFKMIQKMPLFNRKQANSSNAKADHHRSNMLGRVNEEIMSNRQQSIRNGGKRVPNMNDQLSNVKF